MLLPLSALLAVTSTAASGGGLFSEEELPDAPAPVTQAPGSPFSADSEPPPFTPRLRSTTRLELRGAADTAFDRTGEHVAELWLAARLELDAEVSPGVSAYVAPRIEHTTGVDEEGEDRTLLYLPIPEAYLRFPLGPVHFRAGTLIFGWGASDLIAPNDVLNPSDLRRPMFGLGSADEAKLAIPAIEAVAPIGAFTLRGVIAPFFVPSRFFLSGWDSSLALVAAVQGLPMPDLDALLGAPTIDRIGDQILITERPPDTPDQATVGARATWKLGDVDLSGTFVHGFDTFPQLTLEPALAALGGELIEKLAAGEEIDLLDEQLLGALEEVRTAVRQGRTLIRGAYPRRTVAGGDLVVALDPFILKLDVAYTFERTLYTQTFRPLRHPWLTAVAGLEYFDGDTFQLILEAFALTAFDVGPSYRLMLIERRSAPPLGDAERTVALPGAAVVARYTMLDGDLRFELGALGTFTRQDFMLFPAVRWQLDDRHRVEVGAIVIGGRADSYGGIYTTNDQVYVGYRWTP